MPGLWIKINSLIPSGISERLQTKISFGGERTNAKRIVGFVFGFPVFVGLALMLNILAFVSGDPVLLLAMFFAGLLGTFAAMILTIDYYAMARAKRIEKSLPDALELIATNLSSGLTIENAMIESARPEFDELSSLLKRAAKEMFSGRSLEKALRGIAETIDSALLQKTVWLITEGIKKGGTLSNILIRISNDLREEEALKKEINANISMYIMLILIASIVGAPLLFGAGTMVSGMITKQATTSVHSSGSTPQANVPLAGILTANVKKVDSITIDSIRIFALISMALTSFFASLLIGIIRYNKETAGLRYFPVILVLSIGLYLVTLYVFQTMLGGNMLRI